MNPLELFLVRHGESEGNRDKRFTGHGPSPLSPRGVAQAEATGAALAALNVDHVYVSDLVRTRQTAAPLLALTRITPVVLAEIRERDMGRFVGLSFEEVQARYPDAWDAILTRDPDYAPPEGESHRACGDRVACFLDALREKHPHGRVVVVSHGVAIHHMLRHLLGVPLGAVFFQSDNCCIHHVELRGGNHVRVIALNDRRHLAEA